MKKVPIVTSFTLKAFEITYDLRQKLSVSNEKELKLLVTKNPDCSPFR